MFLIHFFYQGFSARGYARSLFLKSYTLIRILLYNGLFKNAIFLLSMYQNYPKSNTHAMTITDSLIMNKMCGYTILIKKYYQQFLLWMDTIMFKHAKIMMMDVIWYRLIVLDG